MKRLLIYTIFFLSTITFAQQKTRSLAENAKSPNATL